MTIYLIDNPPRRDQFRTSRGSARPTGCTVLHDTESMLDEIGEDTGAEGVANFIRTRTTPGSYHDLVDSDSAIQLMPYEYQAYQDGTGSNPWALSISWACRTTDWRRMSPQQRAGMMRQGAIAYRRQQNWLRSKGYPLTPLRRISKAESDRGVPGFVTHGDRDPGRRSDPGVDFPWDEFFAACAADHQEDDMGEYFQPNDSQTAKNTTRLIQTCLLNEAKRNNRPNPLPQFGADGDYGDETKRAIANYQAIRGISTSRPGFVGGMTLTFLLEYRTG